jgi:signal transduction histidine kinase
LISAVAAAAGIALDNERLHQQAQAHLVEARASRTRLVATADAERRRVERNLHDGAQQRMLNLMLALRLAKVRLGGEAYDETADALEEATEQLTLALSELRDLARGIHPAILSESGLGPALRALAQRCSVHVRITDTLNGQRFGTGVEETAYFVVSEALANVAKHACVSEAAVGIRRTGQALLVDVTDDGIGGATLQQGEGLRGLQDRVEAYSGHLTVDSPAGHGTHIRAELPCA